MIVYNSDHWRFQALSFSHNIRIAQLQRCYMSHPDRQALFWLFRTNDESSNPTNEPDV